ncbi:MAG: hypothetical protein WKG01_07740 [Kofleriaceae bacterium]
MFNEIVTGSAALYTLGKFIYHRWWGDKPKRPKPGEFSVPRTDEGAPLQLFWGRIRIRQPAIVWWGNSEAIANEVGNGDVFVGYSYKLDMLFVLGSLLRLPGGVRRHARLGR